MPSAELSSALSRALASWFVAYGCDARVEIEARLRGVCAGEFAYMQRKLRSFAGWARVEATATVDTRYWSGVRSTAGAGAGAEHVVKETLAHVDVALADGVALRVAVAAEDAVPAPSAGEAVQSVRLKDRTRFCLASGVAFDLTRVCAGASAAAAAAAPPEYEVEVEWCGQAAAAATPRSAPAAALLADDFLLKVEDVVGFQRRARQLAREAAAAAAAAEVSGGLAS